MNRPPKPPPEKRAEPLATEVIHTGQAVGAEQKLAARQAAQKARAPEQVVTAAPKPKPKPLPSVAAPRKPAPAGASPKDKGRAAVSGMVDAMFDQLAQEAVRRGGSLSAVDIKGLHGDFSRRSEKLASALDDSFEAYALEKQTVALHSARRMHFERLMVRRFAHVLANDEAELGKNSDKISRRVIPAFNRALAVFVGPDAYDEIQERARPLFEGHDPIVDTGPDVAEERPEVGVLVLDALMAIAANFRDADRRVKWFVDYIETNMPPVGGYGKMDNDAEPPKGGEWHFNDASARMMLKSLFSMLRGALSDRAGREQLAKRHGAEKVNAAARVVSVFR